MALIEPVNHYPVLQNDGKTITCPCGWQREVTNSKYALSVMERHLRLVKES